ncbi:hypothetical protein [Angustibacter sp. Root456]|uniref:hypothetical protein n=1 Tax=Angustibacter sp. Root456 TaxID=1736539 RepID=UPI0006F41102|nr:hypothetical protein [Angustibacter sp. Root456]KQX65787.1 hypothetical protein ASD06_09280 [Angustibacter sp. Root456]
MGDRLSRYLIAAQVRSEFPALTVVHLRMAVAEGHVVRHTIDRRPLYERASVEAYLARLDQLVQRPTGLHPHQMLTQSEVAAVLDVDPLLVPGLLIRSELQAVGARRRRYWRADRVLEFWASAP